MDLSISGRRRTRGGRLGHPRYRRERWDGRDYRRGGGWGRSRGAARVPGAGAIDGLARLGFVVRGAIYVVIGVLAMMSALGYGRHELDRAGALAAIAGEPFGAVLLWLVVVGLAGLALWRAALAATSSALGPGNRLLDAGRALVYAVAAWSAYQFLVEGRSPRSSDLSVRDVSAQLMRTTGGRVVLVVLSAAVVAAGVRLILRTVGKRFAERLRTGWMDYRTRETVLLLGQIGHLARGAIVVAAGVFALYAALTSAPDRAKGLDATLRSFAQTPGGPLVLMLIALGLVAFGLYSFAEARWRRTLGGVPR